MDPSDKKVLVTGATGYIALHVIEQLQEAGYAVRGTVRSLASKAKADALRELFPGIELVEADLTDDKGWKEAVEGCRDVIHVASPFLATPPTDPEKELIQPAVDGTRRVLKACLDARVRRVVLTSSIVSVHGENTVEEGRVYNESDWSDVESPALDAYGRSKTLAEKAAWDFVKDHKDCFELVVINPGLVVGPVHLAAVGTSVRVVKRMLDGTMPLYPRVNMCLCDVRDVAAAHVRALTCEEAVGHRHIIASDHLWFRDMATILGEVFRPLGYSVPRCGAHNIGVWLISFIDGNSRMLLPRLDKVYLYSNARMKNVLGITPRDMSQTLVDTAHSLIKHGLLKKTPAYRAKFEATS